MYSTTKDQTRRGDPNVTQVSGWKGANARALKAYCDVQARICTARPLQGEEGVTTAEYAVVLLAATGFAGVLMGILKSDSVKNALASIINKALKVS